MIIFFREIEKHMNFILRAKTIELHTQIKDLIKSKIYMFFLQEYNIWPIYNGIYVNVLIRILEGTRFSQN